MSLASSPDCQMRAEDKALKLLFPAIGDPLTSSFDDYINQAIYDLSDDDKEDLFLGDVGDLFGSEAFSSGTSSQSPIATSARHNESPQPWRKGLWCLNQNEPARQRIATEKACLPNGVHHQLQALHQPLTRPDCQGPRSPPPTPSHKGTKGFATNSKTATVQQWHHVRQPFSREVTLSPSPMYAALPSGNMRQCESWQQDFQDFHLQVSDEKLPLSPPPSGHPLHHENATRTNAARVAHNGSHLQPAHLMMPSYDMSQPIPSVEHTDSDLYVARLNPTFVPVGPTMLSSPTDRNIVLPHYPVQTQVQPIATWPTGTDNTRHGVEYLHDSQSQTQAWWSDPRPTSNNAVAPNYTHPQEDLYPPIAAPSPQRPVHQLVSSSSHNLGSAGLRIQYSPDDRHATKPNQDHGAPPFSATAPSFSPPVVYPPVSSPKSHSYQQAFSPTSPFATPQRRNPRSPDRSTSISPTTTTTTRSALQKSPTRSARRKSMANPKVSGVVKTPRTPKTPKTPNGGFEINFVNLTAADSIKLLSDVAPSGSSKTRARREQEAKEKRRRLSEAAVRAVRRAGGDVKALKEVIST